MTFEEHAAKSRRSVRAHGLNDCIHYAPNRTQRADALYASAAEAGVFRRGAVVGLLADGRMALALNGVILMSEPNEQA